MYDRYQSKHAERLNIESILVQQCFQRQFVSMLTAYSVANNFCQGLKHILSHHQPGKKYRYRHIQYKCFRETICVESSTGMNCRRRQYIQGRQYMSPHNCKEMINCDIKTCCRAVGSGTATTLSKYLFMLRPGFKHPTFRIRGEHSRSLPREREKKNPNEWYILM